MAGRDVYIAGEDKVTCAILERIIADYAPNLHIVQSLPARGGELKKKISSFNILSLSKPVILLSDMDTDDCAPIAKNKLLNGIVQNECFVINIAVDEAEAWLLADKEGFASYLGIRLAFMPDAERQRFGGRKETMEMEVSLKSSYYLTHELMAHSNNATLRSQIGVMPNESRSKGREYNAGILPFIKTLWNVENARKRSYSLNGMIKRVEALNNK